MKFIGLSISLLFIKSTRKIVTADCSHDVYEVTIFVRVWRAFWSRTLSALVPRCARNICGDSAKLPVSLNNGLQRGRNFGDILASGPFSCVAISWPCASLGKKLRSHRKTAIVGRK